MTETIPNDTKRVLLTQKLEMWQNTLFDARLDTEIAKMLEDEQLAAQSQARMKSALKAIELLKNKLSELAKGSKVVRGDET